MPVRLPTPVLRAVLAIVMVSPLASPTASPRDEVSTQAVYLSDELGGFRIVRVAGSGTRQDPQVVYQQMTSVHGGTLVVRRFPPKKSKGDGQAISTNSHYMRFITTNVSRLSWIGFGFELQEKMHHPSVYGDGLSFDQLSRDTRMARSDKFGAFEYQYEPGDQLLYTNGTVDHGQQVVMEFVITDFTPVSEFYILQTPIIPAS